MITLSLGICRGDVACASCGEWPQVVIAAGREKPTSILPLCIDCMQKAHALLSEQVHIHCVTLSDAKGLSEPALRALRLMADSPGARFEVSKGVWSSNAIPSGAMRGLIKRGLAYKGHDGRHTIVKVSDKGRRLHALLEAQQQMEEEGV